MNLSYPRRPRFLVAAVSSVLCSAFLSGCGIDSVDHSISGSSALRGTVHGGQQPVVGAVIQLYAVGSGGSGSPSRGMLTGGPVTTGADGSFDITGLYTCGKSSLGTTINSPSHQVYLVASLGDPGLTPAATNHALSMMTALGDCADLATLPYVEVNEITTAAAVWALAPFMTSSNIPGVTASNVGVSYTNIAGIQNAFLDAHLLADPTTGQPTYPIPPPDVKPVPVLPVETAKLISLANALAVCVNSDGSTGCMPLFSAATTSTVVPEDTLAAALNIVQNPGQKVAAVFAAIGDRPSFGGGLTTAPNDWTMSYTVTGGGLDFPIALAIDQTGNVWVAGHDGPLSAFNPQGVPLSTTGYGVGDFEDANGMAIDANGDIWVTQYNDNTIPGSGSGAVTKFLGAESSAGSVGSVVLSGGYPGFTTDIYFPYAVAADPNGNMYVANNGNGSATVLATDGSVVGDQLGATLTNGSFPDSIAVDSTNGFWLPTKGTHVDHISADGKTLLSTTACCATAWGVATDSYGNLWVADYEGLSFSEIGPDGTLLIDGSQIGGVYYPQYLAVDAAQNVWFANVLGDSITEIASNPGGASSGVAISPSATPGVNGSGGYGHDAKLRYASHIAPDASGNIWVTNPNLNTVTMFFGLATPTVTPIQPVPTAP